MKVAANGRFTLQPLTGVQRYAREISSRLADRLDVLVPPGMFRGARGHLWEQTILPARTHGRLLWSPGNTGPLAVGKQVVTIHDCAVFDAPQGFTSAFAWWYRKLLPRLARRVRRVLTVSEFSRQRLIEWCRLDPQRVTAVPNGVDSRFRPVAFSPQAPRPPIAGLPSSYVLCLGSLEPRKNLRRLLDAWRRAPELHSDLTLVLTGGNAGMFREAGLDPLPPSVLLTGRVADEHLPALYAGATMFVYPSLYEGFGLTVLEAMASGTPVICSNTTSLPEVAGDAACLIDPTDVDSLAAAMVRLANDAAERSELRERGLARAERFSWDAAADRTWSVLQEAADEV